MHPRQPLDTLPTALYVANRRATPANHIGWSHFPPDDGFLPVDGTPARYPQTLTASARIDRFGFPGGTFLAPASTPFTERALHRRT